MKTVSVSRFIPHKHKYILNKLLRILSVVDLYFGCDILEGNDMYLFSEAICVPIAVWFIVFEIS